MINRPPHEEVADEKSFTLFYKSNAYFINPEIEGIPLESYKVVSSSRKKYFGSSETLLKFCTIKVQKALKVMQRIISLQKVKNPLNMGRGRYGFRVATPIFA